MTSLFKTYRDLLETALGVELPIAEINFLEDLSVSHEGHEVFIDESDGVLSVKCITCKSSIHDIEMVRKSLKK